MEKLLKIEKELGEVHESTKSAHRRIDSLEKVVNVVYELSTSVKVMAEKMDHMNDNISGMKKDIDEYHHKEPNKLIFNVKNAIIVGVVSAIIGAILALILK